MQGYLTIKEAAQKFGCSYRWVSKLCQDNRIPGVERVGWSYLIPEDAELPTDRRVTTGEYRDWKKKYGKNKIPGFTKLKEDCIQN